MQTWFITGCSSGFGRALVDAALAAGQQVVATARQPGALTELAFAANCHVLPLDVTDPAQVQAAVAEAHRRCGALDVIVNNAGRGLVGAVEECTEEQLRRNFEVNFFGALAVTRAALPYLRAQRRGHLVNVSAAAALGNYAGFGIYGAAKAALELASESLRLELAPLGIRVTLVEPGPFRTDFINRLERAESSLADYAPTAGKFARYLASVDGRQPGDPQRAAAAIIAHVLAGDGPFRLPLGRYAVRKMQERAASLARDAAAAEGGAAGADRPAGA